MDGQPDARPTAIAARSPSSLAARVARAVDEGEPLPDLPQRLIEENMWRAIRYGLVRRADRLRARGLACPHVSGSRG